MDSVLTKDTLAVYKGKFKNIQNLQGLVMEDTPVSEGYVWMDFGNKRIHRVSIQTLDFTDIGVIETDNPVVKKEEMVEVATDSDSE